MPFIWDDDKYLLVGDVEEYDKSRFVVVRKVFVEPITPYNQEEGVNGFTEDNLNTYFRRFGDIESIEISASNEPLLERPNRIIESKAYAFITFQRDVFALAAVLYNSENQISFQNEERKYIVEPANTWKQPSQQNSTVENMILDEDYVPPILMLNTDCFEILFQHLDIDSLMNLLEVNIKINSLVLKHGFRHIKSFQYMEGKTTFGQMRRMLKCIGKNINQLEIECSRNFPRLCDIMRKYLGGNVRCADFKFNLSKDRDIIAIRPILGNLTSLRIGLPYGDLIQRFDFDFDLLRTLCPNLTKLKLEFDAYFVGLDKPWQKLEYFSTMCKSNQLCEFLQQNQQIKTLKFLIQEHNDQDIVAPFLPDLQKLTIRTNSFEGPTLVDLTKLKNLTKLSLYGVLNTRLYEVLDGLKVFQALRELKISMDDCNPLLAINYYSMTHKSIIKLAEVLLHLERLCLDGIDLMESTVLEFIRFASKLKEIHIHHCDLEFTEELILEIVEIRKTFPSQSTTEPLELFIFYEDATDFEAIQQLDIKSYLLVNTHCNHK